MAASRVSKMHLAYPALTRLMIGQGDGVMMIIFHLLLLLTTRSIEWVMQMRA